MEGNSLLNMFRSFFGLQSQPPSNEFRNPIWGDDDDDGDELYDRQSLQLYGGQEHLHSDMTKQVFDMMTTFGDLFGGNFKSFFHDELPALPPVDADPDAGDNRSIRDYYLKPGFDKHKMLAPKQDMDLDGKVSSQDISGLLKSKSDSETMFDSSNIPGRTFCKTVITTSIKKPDGTIETKRIVKSGNQVTEETTTSQMPLDSPPQSGLDMMNTDMFYETILKEFASHWKNIHH